MHMQGPCHETRMLSSVLPSLRMLMDDCPMSSMWHCSSGWELLTSAFDPVGC